MTDRSIQSAGWPLRLIFWGGLLVIFDLSYSQTENGVGYKFDVLNDFVGASMIAVGVGRLALIQVNERYRRAIGFARFSSLIGMLFGLLDHLILPVGVLGFVVLSVLGLVGLVAIPVFCTAMRLLCLDAQLLYAADSWSVTKVLFVVIYLVPMGLSYLVGMVAAMGGRPIDISVDSLAWSVLVLVVFAIPVIHLFIGTSRMKHSAELAGFPNRGVR